MLTTEVGGVKEWAGFHKKTNMLRMAVYLSLRTTQGHKGRSL
jgi:hypothetical protein